MPPGALVGRTAKSGNLVLWPLAALLIAALLLVGLTSSAAAGGGGKGTATAAKKKCKRKSKGSAKSSKRKKCHRKRPGRHRPGSKLPAPPSLPTLPAGTTLAISPPGFNFGSAQHGGFGSCGADPDPNCPTQAFTVTNIGAATSGTPSASITELHNPEIGGVAAYQITSNTCNLALAPGASCSITVKFAPNSNAGDAMYSSRLDVTATPGGTASSLLSGMAD
jgi:hypothetical protein